MRLGWFGWTVDIYIYIYIYYFRLVEHLGLCGWAGLVGLVCLGWWHGCVGMVGLVRLCRCGWACAVGSV